MTKGTLYFYKRPDTTVVKTQVEDREAEKERLDAARQISMEQLEALAEKARAESGDETAILFETHAMFVEDDDYAEMIDELLESEGCNAEYAVKAAGEQFAAMFAAMDDAYYTGIVSDQCAYCKSPLILTLTDINSIYHFRCDVLIFLYILSVLLIHSCLN